MSDGPKIGRRDICIRLPAALGAAWLSNAMTGCGGSDSVLPPSAVPDPMTPLLDSVHVSLDALLGPFDRLSGVQGSPYPEVPEDIEHVAEYRAHHIERARFPQDCPPNELTLAGIFPNAQANPDNPASYRFAPIDRHVRAAGDAGARVLWQSSYDIGLSDRWLGPNLGGRPIANLDVWARVLTRCLEHFTVGWANGFDRGIADVEFLNEPDGLGGYRDQWPAMYAAFSRFLEVVRAHNARHPGASVRPVGPGIPLSIAEWPTYRQRFETLLSTLPSDGLSLPVFSFHTYGADVSPAGNARLAREFRSLLDRYGMVETALWNSEWQAGNFLGAHLRLDAASFAALPAAERRTYAQGVASYALSCKARWQGLVTGSFYYRAGRRAFPPGGNPLEGFSGDGSIGFFSPQGRVGAMGLQELLTYRIAQRTPERCAIAIADDPLFTGLGLRGEGVAGALLANLATRPRLVRVRVTGGPPFSTARVVRIDTDAQTLVGENVPLARASDGGFEAEVLLGPLAPAVLELE